MHPFVAVAMSSAIHPCTSLCLESTRAPTCSHLQDWSPTWSITILFA